MSAGSTDSTVIRQILLQNALSPLVSVSSTHNADVLLQNETKNPSVSALVVLKPYGNNVKHGYSHQSYKITSSSLITKTYASFPVRFEPSLSELLTVHNPVEDNKLNALFKISSLELLMDKIARSASSSPSSELNLFSSMFRRIVTSNRVVSFDTLNHPVAQIFIVDHENDTIDKIRQMVVEFRNYAFPKYFQNSDILIHVFILYRPSSVSEPDIQKFQSSLRKELSILSTIIPLTEHGSEDSDYVFLDESESPTIDQEIQTMSFQSTIEGSNSLKVPTELDLALRAKVFEFISRHLIPHMERKIRNWDDSVLSPKKSITGRFFSVSRKLFNNNSNNAGQGLGDTSTSTTATGTFNHNGNYYHRSAPEQVIRKLADWSLMLKDFKYAYSTYEFIKKDYTNDKAWIYVASTQEMCIVSLLLAQTQPLASDTMPQRPDKNTLRKIRHDIIEPYVDNLSYTYKSRFNVKTYAIRSYLVVAELLLNMSIMFNIPWWWSDLIDGYLMKAEREFETHLAGLSTGPKAIKAILFERLGHVKLNSFFIPNGHINTINEIFAHGVVEASTKEVEEGFYVNHAKLMPQNDTALKGLTRFRKSSFWYIMSMREWMLLENPSQIRALMHHVTARYTRTESGTEWYEREDLVLAKVRQTVEE